MTNQSLQWASEIEHYAKHNGPIILGASLGISSEEAADKLIEHGETQFRNGYTNILTMADVLRKPVISCSKNSEKNPAISFNDRFPTLTQWLSENKRTIAILRSGHNFAFVAGGIVIESNGWTGLREKVTHCIIIKG